MLISAIVAISKNNVIGRDGHLPWHLSADLKRFKAITTGHSIILGRKNYDDIGRPLPNRTNYVLTRNAAFEAPGCIVCNSLAQAIESAQTAGENECFIIGRIASKHTISHGCLETLLDRRNEFLRNVTTCDLVDKLQTTFLVVLIDRTYIDDDICILTTTARLLLVNLTVIYCLRDSFLVVNLRLTLVTLYLELTLQTINDNIQVQLTHT